MTLDVSDASGQFASGEVAFETTSAAVRNIGRVTTLDDPRFAAENGPLGLWRPLDFLEGPGAGLFMLGEYDAGRMPVVFVHGIGGTPRDFSAAIAGLDRGRYQPWVLSYPSGVRLDMVSDYLVTALRGLHGRHGFRRFAVVAHSMGGLVTRSFVQKLVERHPDTAGALRLVVTVNSPMLGMASAASGVEHSPIVVPVWQDVATGSEFVARLAAARWPAQVPYHLVFSYSDGDSGDGTVPLDSQIPIELQALATRIHGFKGTHTGTLSNPEFLSLLSELLASVGPVQAAPGP